ncbi:MAG: 4-hydroxy-tetrahydrodipicolinate synthase [Solirubrobacterales bacterium]
MTDLGAILTAIVTPFDAEGRIDEDAFVRMMRHLADNGSDGIVVAGTTGEAPTLDDDEHLALIGLAVREAPEGFTVVAGTGSNDTHHAVMLTEQATELGVDAVLSVTPYYNRPNRRGIVAHFEHVSRATDRPIVLYNIPSRTGTDMPNDLLAELAQLPNVEAVKQANAANLAPVDGLQIYAGDDDILRDTLAIGGAGAIAVASHIVGPQMKAMCDEPERRDEIHDQLSDVFTALNVTVNPIPIKTALKILGFNVGGFRLPMVEASDDEAATIRAMLERNNLLTHAAN